MLSNLFNVDDIEIVKVNKKYFKLLIIISILLIFGLIIEKDNYYSNSFTIIDNNMILLVEKDYINKVKNSKKIIIDDIEDNYSINTITPSGNIYMVNINLSKINNTIGEKYKIFLGKEKLFDYIIRILKK